MTAVVEVEDATFSFGDVPAVEDVSLTVEEGDFVGIVGPNGSGKSTLIKLMLGLVEPDQGRVLLYGVRASRFQDGSRLGYVSQYVSRVDRRIPVTVREVVEMGRFARAGIFPLRAEDHDAVGEAMQQVRIADLADRKLTQLSGGQRQRVFVARALASKADLLFLDEPAIGVDIESRERFYGLLHELNEQGITIVLIEHDIGVVTSYANLVACINRQLYCHTTPEDFLAGDFLERAYGTEQEILRHEHQRHHHGK